jgi:DNA-directed RNA polymerase subunit beta'
MIAAAMAYLDPKKAFEHLKERVLEGIQDQFAKNPIVGKKQSLHLEALEVRDKLGEADDIRAQHKAKVENDTWAVPIYATLALKDNETGKALDRRTIRIAEIPKTTNRHSYIIDGQEYQVNNQWQLRHGIYVKRRVNGELEAACNAGRGFDVVLDPATKVFRMEHGKSRGKLPIYPFLKTLGVSDEDLMKSWGKEMFEANQKAPKSDIALEKFYKADKPWAGTPTKEVAAEHFYDMMEKTHLRPESTQLTLGRPFTHVSGEALKLATEKMLKVQAGHPEDDRDSLVFKDLRTAGDFAYDAILHQRKNIETRAGRQIDKAKDAYDVMKFDMFNKPIKGALSSANAAAMPASQINPLEMASSAMQTTIMGAGGIRTAQQVQHEAKFVNPSHLGFLDPLNTPEGEKTGVTLRLPIGVRKVGHEAKIPLYNLLSKKTELVSPGEFMEANIVLPDQVKWEDGVPHPLHHTVRASSKGNEIRDVKFEDAHYVMRSPSQLFNMTSNLIPFLANTSGNRASMASRHMEQAVSLLHREAPLVQVGTGSDKEGIDTFENIMGYQASHAASEEGKVVAVNRDGIIIEDRLGKKHEVQLYNNYPLNDAKSVMHSTPVVAVGDHVKKGQLIADTNFSKNGTLALGTNLRVAYLPFKGYNFEDGVVISDSAAKKLSSEHLQKLMMPLDQETILDKKRFHISNPGLMTKEQYEKMDSNGIVRVGQKVQPGDPLVAAMRPYKLKDRTGMAAVRKAMGGRHDDRSMRWDSDFEGEVVGVHRSDKGLTVHVRTVEPMQVGDKISNRYGGKGIVTKILPDPEMPHTKDGKHIEVALNPSGIPGRMNVGQVFETSVAKIAEKTGKPYIVKNFDTNMDVIAKVQADLKAHGLSDTEELKDPATGQILGQVTVGPQHIFKLVHQIDKKLAVRSGSGTLPGAAAEHYDLNLQPMGGKSTGGQSMGTLGLFALLAHGAKANIREMQTYKSEGPDPQTDPAKRWPSDHHRIWAAIQTGHPLPTPKPTFAYRKFEDMLRGSGINIEKKGHDLILSPMTDQHIRALAKNALPHPADMLNSKMDKNGDPKPKAGGLWDEKLTGGLGGRQWTRIELSEPLPNPIFEKPIKALTGLSPKDFNAVLHGSKGVTANGNITEAGAGVTGGAGIKVLLDRVNVARDLAKAEAQLKIVKGQSVDRVLKKVKYLRALKQIGVTPSEAYILHNIPVMPPIMRPVSKLPDGSPKFDDINQLYSDFAKINDKLKDPILVRNLTDEGKSDLRKDFYDGAKMFMGMGLQYGDAKHKGLLHQIAGSSPKHGYFQDKLIARKQDLTMRSTIVPEPGLDLDEVGLPKHAALELFKPFVVRQLKQMGAIQNEVQGAAFVEKKSPQVWRALDRVMAERPILLKRDPALHKYNVQAFRARPIEGDAVRIHPLVTGGYNADFDGDTMSAFVPITHDAVNEAVRMFPSHNLFSEATGRLMYQPTLESALGLYKLSVVGKDSGQKFEHAGLALDAVRSGKLGYTDVVHIGGKKTTPGRILLSSAVPEAMQSEMLHDLHYRIDGKSAGLSALLTGIAKHYGPQYGEVVNKLKDLGNTTTFGAAAVPRATSAGHAMSFSTLGKNPVATLNKKMDVFIPVGAHTLSLKDFEPDKASRDHVLSAAHKVVEKYADDPKMTKDERDRRTIAVYEHAADEMKALHEKKEEKDPSNLYTMYKAGVKPGWDQYKQMVLAPMIYKDSADRKIPIPVTKSYAEGLDVGSYWTQMHGARRGSVMKVQEVSGPGYLSKLLMNNMMHILVNSPDCGTSKGIVLDANEADIHDRYLQQEFTHGKVTFPAGTLLTPSVVGKIRAAKKDAKLLVRSPLKCEDPKGICQMCSGLGSSGQHYDLGHNLGVQSAQAVGERGIQLALKSFHTGGVGEHKGGSKLLNSFERFKQLMYLPEKVQDESSLAMKTGKVEQIVPTSTGVDIFIGGQKHHVGRDTKGMPLHQPLPGAEAVEGYVHWKVPVVGQHLKAGDTLSDPNRTLLNPHHLYAATGSIEEVQNHLTNEIYGLYQKEGIKRRAIETVVRAMSNLTKVNDPGEHPDVLRGEFYPLAQVQHMNQELLRNKKRPIEHEPVMKGISAMPHALIEDWMAKLQHEHLRTTLTEAAAMGGISHLHSTHPIPAIAFGAEFGLTSKDALKPGHEHLRDVPAHYY